MRLKWQSSRELVKIYRELAAAAAVSETLARQSATDAARAAQVAEKSRHG